MENLTSIEVLAKTTEENLRVKNAAFLEKYPTEESQIDYYTDLAMKVFDKFDIDGTFETEGVRKNVCTWFENKKGQMNLFRKHPYWNEEAKAIVFSQNEQRVVDYSVAELMLAELVGYINRKLDDRYQDKVIIALYFTIYDLRVEDCDQTSTMTEEFIEKFRTKTEDISLPKDVERMLRVGTKITKFARKCFTHWKKGDGTEVDVTTLVDDHAEGDRNYNSFDKIYAKFADSLSELVIQKITLVSLHFCDFMLMSNGNSWLSCHYINSNNIFHDDNIQSYSGSSKQGCLSYALDAPSFLLYTLPGTYEGEEYYLEPKLNRMCCQYHKGVIVTGKCYPNNKDACITRYRQTLQLIISTIEGAPNLWTFSRKISKITAFVTTDDDAGHYRDYEYSNQKPTISLCKNFGIDLDETMTIGHEAYCVHCGTGLGGYDHNWLQCNRHRRRKKCRCCGRLIENEDDRIYIDGNTYCRDCTFYCDYHKEYELIEDGKNELDLGEGYHIDVCDRALQYYSQCNDCGVWFIKGNGHYGNGKQYCNKCYCKLKADDNWHPNFEVIGYNDYKIGDYVLMVDDVSVCRYTATPEMRRHYPNRIARITDADRWNSDRYELTLDPDDYDGWAWSSNCFVGKIIGDVSDDILGKTLEEIM
jgi:hypothetical protein